MQTKHLLIGNWKMNLSIDQATKLADQIGQASSNLKHTQVWIAPAFTHLFSTCQVLKNKNVKVGSQNVHWEDKGAFTGEISLPMLNEIGCNFIIVGHSERRKYFGETNNTAARRACAALKSKNYVAFCVGETLEERARGSTEEIIREQLDPVFYHLRDGEEKYLTLSYEPAWAIGSGNVAPVEEIEKVHEFIANYWKDTVNSSLRDNCPPILYGGSVKPENFAPIIGSKHVMGALVGGASLDFEKFSALIRTSEEQAQIKFGSR